MKINTGTLNNSTSFERNYGIDLLRILSMLMVVVLHILGCGGVIAACERFSFNYYVAWYLEAAAYCAVDVFAMITGYVMINGKFNTFKMIPLWLTVFFYSSLIAILFEFVPALSFLYKPSLMELLKSVCIPVVSRQYWYFTSYFGLFFFIPFINTLLHNLNEKQHRVLCLTIIILFSILPLLGLKQIDTFSIGGGIQPYG